ncbi:MAG: hypothetical protein EHM91_08080 [Planctomycetota bacterium]|nr:MAG: hypothetical protein EHM91_08080 [Planctomycetota bacterium]
MSTSDPQEKKAALCGWLERLAADPAKAAAEAKEFLEMAGDLYDEEHLDGAQYALFYDLKRSLQVPGMPATVDLARRCLATIT